MCVGFLCISEDEQEGQCEWKERVSENGYIRVGRNVVSD